MGDYNSNHTCGVIFTQVSIFQKWCQVKLCDFTCMKTTKTKCYWNPQCKLLNAKSNPEQLPGFSLQWLSLSQKAWCQEAPLEIVQSSMLIWARSAGAGCSGLHAVRLSVSPEMETPYLWATCASVFDQSKKQSFFPLFKWKSLYFNFCPLPLVLWLGGVGLASASL